MSDKIKFPCCVNIQEFNNTDIEMLVGALVRLGAEREEVVSEGYEVGTAYVGEEDIIPYVAISVQEALGDVSELPATLVLPEGDSSYNQGKSLIDVKKISTYEVTLKGSTFILSEEEYYELWNKVENT